MPFEGRTFQTRGNVGLQRTLVLLLMLVIAAACGGPVTTETAVATVTPLSTAPTVKGPPTLTANPLAVTKTADEPLTQVPSPLATAPSATPKITEVTVFPSLSGIEPSEAVPGEEIKIQGTGGHIELRHPDGAVTGYIESARFFDLFLDGQAIGSISCYVNTCNGAFVLPVGTGPGEHEISVEGGSSQTLRVPATPTATPPPIQTPVPAGTPTAVPTASLTPVPIPTATPMPFVLSTTAFFPGGAIPFVYTCDGQDTSPALSWTPPPAATQTFAILMDDPDAPGGVWDHWVAFNLPPDLLALPAGRPKVVQLASGAVQGRNSWGSSGYGGPARPRAHPILTGFSSTP